MPLPHLEPQFPLYRTPLTLLPTEPCIEHLRQSIMCSGDVALDRWEYDFEDKVSYLRTDAVPHVCKDWSMLSGWVSRNQLRLEDWRTN